MEGEREDEQMPESTVSEADAQSGNPTGNALLVPVVSWGGGSAPSVPSIDSDDQVS